MRLKFASCINSLLYIAACSRQALSSYHALLTMRLSDV